MKFLEALDSLREIGSFFYDTMVVTIKNLNLEFEILSSENESQIHLMSSEFSQGYSYMYALKKETLCRSLIKINGERLPDFMEDEVTGEKLEKNIWLKRKVFGDWSQQLIDEVYKLYADLVEKIDKKIKLNVKIEMLEKKDTEIKKEE